MDNKKINFIQTVFFLTALVWIFLGLSWLWRLTGYVGRENIAYFNSSVMLINSLIILIVALLIRKQKKLIYWFAIVYLMANIILTITDQFGFFDLIILLIELIALAVLAGYKAYLTK